MAFSSLSPPLLPLTQTLVSSYLDSARVAGTTDDRAGIIAAAAAAVAVTHKTLYLAPGTYRTSKYIDISGYHGLRIVGYGARIIHASDDTAVAIDAIATSTAIARCTFFGQYCSNITFEGITFQGGNNANLDQNVGPAIYLNHSVDTKVIDCNLIDGSTLVYHDASSATTGTGDSLTASGGFVTLVDAAGLFKTGHGVGVRNITISGCANPLNNGTFRIVSYTSATTIVFENAHGVTETIGFKWTIDDNDRGLRVRGGRSRGARHPMRPTNDTVIDGHTFSHPDTGDVTGLGDSFTISGTTVTLKDQSRLIGTQHVGRYITITGSTSPGNDGRFLITSVTAKGANNTAASIVYTNASGVTELFTGQWWVVGGEKSGIGAGVAALSIEGGTISAVDTGTDTYTRVGHGYVTGTQVRFSTTGTLPSPLGTGFSYSVIRVDADNFKVATSWTAAQNGTAVNITTTGSGTHSVSAGTTLTSASASFSSSDLWKTLRILEATTPANNECGTIGVVHSSTQATFAQFGSTAEDFFGQWSIDGHDRAGNYGSSHGIYGFAGRSNIKIVNCTFLNIRETGVKFSGSTLPISDITVANNYFYQVATVATFGADDSQEHNGFTFTGNVMVDCGTQRKGWSTGEMFTLLGSRGLELAGNTFLFTRNNIASVDGRTMAGQFGLVVQRYAGTSTQPVEDFSFHHNKFLVDPRQTDHDNVLNKVIKLYRIGVRAHWASCGALTKSGDVMTMASSTGGFSSQLVGCTIQLVNTNGSNDVTSIVETASGGSLTFTNAAGSAAAAGGTFRIFPSTSGTSNGPHRAGACVIDHNVFQEISGTVIEAIECVAPQITNNKFFGVGTIDLFRNVMPLVDRNEIIGANTDFAMIRINDDAWPLIGTNYSVNTQYMSTSVAARGFRVGYSSGGADDFPLLGFRGRAKATNAQEEVVVGYGGNLVDGDTLLVSGTTYTYKASAPAGNQFNSFASLVALIDAQAGLICTDYGAQFSTPVTTNHLHIRRDSTSATDGNLTIGSTTLNPTALVIMRNSNSYRTNSRGCGSAGPIADKTVVWSPLVGNTAVVSLVAGNETARGVLAGSPAEGKITCVAKVNLVDTDYITIGDGLSAPKLYEFDTAGDGVTAGRVQVNVSTDTTAIEVAARLRTAILANQPALSVTDNADGTLTVSHLIRGPVGNVTITENVTNAGFTVTGLANGGGGGFFHVRNTNDDGACAVLQHAKSSNQAGTDLGAEFRWSIA